MDNFDLKKYLAEGKLSLRKPTTLKEGKGQDLADEYVAKLRVLFKNLNDDELGEFKKTITKSLDLNESINEGDSNPMSNLLQTFEKAMTDKATYDEVVAELEGAPDHVKPKLMQMADEVIPEQKDGILELIDDLETGQIDPEDIDANETKEVLIQQFKEFVKVTDFAIATIKKHVNESKGLKESPEDEGKEQTVAKGKWEIVKVPKGSNNSTRFGDRYYLLLGGQHVGGSVTADGSFSPPSSGNSSEDYVMKILKKAKIVESVNESINEAPTRADFYKQIEKEAFTAGWDSYEENANVEDAFNKFSAQQDAAQEEPKSYAAGGGSDFIDPMGLRESTDLEEGMSDEGIVKSIEDIRDSLESGESDGMPLDNETEALLYQELERLRDMLLKKGLSALDTY